MTPLTPEPRTDPITPARAGGTGSGPSSTGRAKSPDSTVGWHRMTGLGVEFIVAVALLGAAGWWADRRLGTGPWLLLIGGCVGFAVGLWKVVRIARKSFR